MKPKYIVIRKYTKYLHYILQVEVFEELNRIVDFFDKKFLTQTKAAEIFNLISYIANFSLF